MKHLRKEKKLNNAFYERIRSHFLYKSRKKGFTLVEVVANMAIMGIIMAIVTSLTSISLNSFKTQQHRLAAVELGRMITTNIQTEIEKVGHVKLENFYVKDESSEHNNDIYSSKDEPYPMSFQDACMYSTIFVKSDYKIDGKYATNAQKNDTLEPYQRAGKLYKVNSSPFYKRKNIKDTNGKIIHNKVLFEDVKDLEVEAYMEPMFDDDLYNGYLVDVRFEYVSMTDITKEPGQTGKPVVQDDIKGILNSIKVIVDIYNGSTKVHTATTTVLFLQKYFSMDKPKGPESSLYTGEKSVLYFRG